MAKRIRAASGVSTGKADPVRKAIGLSLVTAVERCMTGHIGRPRANSGYLERKRLTRLGDFMTRMPFRACDAPPLTPRRDGSANGGPHGCDPILAMVALMPHGGIAESTPCRRALRNACWAAGRNGNQADSAESSIGSKASAAASARPMSCSQAIRSSLGT